MGWPTLVAFPDVDLLLTDYLRDALTARPEPYASGVTVSIHVPNPRDDRMVIVRRAGGPRLDWTRERARVVFQSWALSWPDAISLSRLVSALVSDAPDPVVHVLTSAGPARVYDDSEQPMVTFTADLTVRGADL
jgi:hypothetical protein